MKVRDLIANLKKEDLEGEVYIQIGESMIDDVYEVTNGKNEDGSSFTVIIPENDEE